MKLLRHDEMRRNLQAGASPDRTPAATLGTPASRNRHGAINKVFSRGRTYRAWAAEIRNHWENK